jgi:Uncharacterised nucleotidyltransferase
VSWQARAVSRNLRVDAGTAEVLRGFDAVGVQSLLLKGASVARWLYRNEDPRNYVDCDLLVRPVDIPAAEDALRRLGFEPELDRREMPPWWQEHAVAWVRHETGSVVDLHHTLPGVGVDAERLWSTLRANSEPIVVGRFEAQTLTVPGRAFLLALHAAHHGAAFGRALADLERGISTLDVSTWRSAAVLATSLGAIPAFATGLRLVPGGAELATRLGLSTESAVDVELKATTPPPVALGFDQLARADSLRARLSILRHKVVPPPTFMRLWSPRAQEGRFGLILAYLWRPIWLLTKAPAGFRAWRAARRRARSASGDRS